MTLSINMIGSFAREVNGLRIWESTEDLTIARLADAWSRHGILIFRRQSISEDELVAFSERFGDPNVIVREDWKSENRPEVIQITNMKDYNGNSIGGLGAGELNWHTDQSYVTEPATGSILYMVEMPKDPPVTYWANLQLAYDALDSVMKERIDKLNVIYDYFVRQSTYDDEPEMSDELRQRTPAVTHPLVNIHPETGNKSMYLDPTTAAGVEGWETDSGQKLLQELVAHATQPKFVYAHQWQIGDVVMWDNGFLMHRRDSFEPVKNRLLKRTTLRLPADRHIVPKGALAE
ncbi:TauD/TfdA family dioxygenase [Alphaproteobacteria bacterium]|jgi:alpha-ketoglutarate-dependent taurine dioxygenase|nr:TauD/TfdA family dioxygenase [Alphaproteobacteria bacterium]